MLKFCVEAWDKNKEYLEKAIRADNSLNSCDYVDLVKLVVKYILNPMIEERYHKFNPDGITIIDNGDYQGTLLFMIPRGTYQPDPYDYLLTYVYYGSCSGCDTLQSIQNWSNELPTEQQVIDFMTLCRHLVCNMVKPYNGGWCCNEDFKEVVVEGWED